MEARIKKEKNVRTIQSCSGCEFVSYEWRLVPPGFETEARNNPYLETREPEAPKAEKVVKPKAEKVEKPKEPEAPKAEKVAEAGPENASMDAPGEPEKAGE